MAKASEVAFGFHCRGARGIDDGSSVAVGFASESLGHSSSHLSMERTAACSVVAWVLGSSLGQCVGFGAVASHVSGFLSLLHLVGSARDLGGVVCVGVVVWSARHGPCGRKRRGVRVGVFCHECRSVPAIVVGRAGKPVERGGVFVFFKHLVFLPRGRVFRRSFWRRGGRLVGILSVPFPSSLLIKGILKRVIKKVNSKFWVR